jgi:hypothetical protein
MKANQLATLVLRLLGIYCLIQVIPAFNLVINMIPFVQGTPMDGHNDTFSGIALIMALLFPFGLRLVAGILLLLRSVAWGERLMPNENGQQNITAISFQQAQVLAFAVAGVLIFADALPSLFLGIFNLANWFEVHASHPELQSNYTLRNGLTALGALAKALLGLGLFFCAHGFANFWRSLRNFGTPKPPEQ